MSTIVLNVEATCTPSQMTAPVNYIYGVPTVLCQWIQTGVIQTNMKKKNKILKLWKNGLKSKRAISKKVGVSRSYVCKIIKQSTI